jgi:regulator of sigma D
MDGVTSTTAELNILDGVTATASELNILDGVTATASELNILDGVTSTTAELNILDGVTSTAAELNVLDGYTGSVTELNYLDSLHATGVTATEYDYLDGVSSNIQTQLDAKKASADHVTKLLSGDASNTTYTITHGLATPIVSCTVLDYGNAGSGATYDQVMVEIKRNSDNAVDVVFAAAPGTSQDYLVLVSKFPAIS